METKNTGKIVIAIVAMFAVAISIVGVTYAYFSASVVNNKTTKSVEVTAGILEINYINGNEMVAQNLVPGWESDGQHYYDPTGSVYDANGVRAVKAITADECTGDVTCSIDNPQAENGITNPVTFSVKNTDRNQGDTEYAIRLTNITNEIASKNEADAANLTYTLYSSTTENATTGGTQVSTGVLGKTGETQVIVPSARKIAANGEEQYYYLMLSYANKTDGEQNSSMDAMVKATVEIVGITNNGAAADGKTGYKDADGKDITFPTTS